MPRLRKCFSVGGEEFARKKVTSSRIPVELIQGGSGTITTTAFSRSAHVLSAKKTEHFKQLLETRIAKLERVLATAQRETRVGAARHAADQAASEYERQSLH